MAAAPDEERDSRVSGEGASLGEAKWNAVKLLERAFPGTTADEIRFEVIDEGDGEAGRPARVSAELDLAAWRESRRELPDEPADRLRALVARVVQGLGLHASVDIEETEDELRATVNGDDLGLLIGKHGQTIDALQHIAVRAAYKGSAEHKHVVVDAAGYRDRRAAALHRVADRAVSDALDFGRAVELEPMSAQERKVVHLYLRERTDVETHSEGDDPDRRLVISPVRSPR